MVQPALPRVIDRYELLAELGSGGFATVYRARHALTHQEVAVKVLRPRDPGSDRWISEARAAAAVQHRNVVRVLDCGHAGDEVFIVMELVSGPTLADVIASEGPMPAARAVGIAVQLLDGLAVAHARSIVHRDIKPPNVIVTRDENGADLPKILDFGVSKQTTEMSHTLDGTAIGTPGYMAPELFGGAKHADARADVYAMAATLYEMLSGKLPFAASTYEELVVQVATSRPSPLSHVAPHVPPAIAAAVDRGLARDREARWPDAEHFASALRGALVGIAPPQSDPFQATMDARAVTSPSAQPRVPTLTVPDPSTLRTAPPPVVSTANRVESRSRSALPWTIGLVAGLLVFGGVAAFAGLRMMRSRSDSTPSATPPVVAVAASAPVHEAELEPLGHERAEANPGGTTVSPPPATVTTSAAVATTAPTAPTSGGIRFKFPAKVVGSARAIAIDTFAQRVIPLAQRCRPPHGAAPITVHVRLFIQAEGKISIAQPADDTDEATATCLGEYLKDAANPSNFAPGGGGIAVLEAKLEPR